MIIQTLSLIPFFRVILKFLYKIALRKLRSLALESNDIIDILLISNMKDHDFIYGSSDLNLIILIKNDTPAQKFLDFTRRELIRVWPTNMLVDIKNLNILKENEVKTPLIRSIMVTRYEKNEVHWNSILKKEFFTFILKEQDHHNIQFNYVKRIEKMLLNPKKSLLINRHWIRSFGKSIFFSIDGLSQYGLISIEKQNQLKWKSLSKKVMRYTFLYRTNFKALKIHSLRAIDDAKLKLEFYKESPIGYQEDFLHFCESLTEFPIVKDIILNPALIQLDSTEMKGKVFVDIILGRQKGEFTTELLHSLQDGVDYFLSQIGEDHPKYVFQFSTFSLLKIKCEQALFDYPLEYHYRIEQSISIKGYKYKFKQSPKQIEKACIQFLMREFMRFRTLKHQNKLIGSQFIKSLNIIYRYQLLLNFLRGQEFAVSHSYISIMEELTPQLTNIPPDYKVDDHLWQLIRAQMLYLLKRIRDELSRKNPSLKNIQF